MKIFFTIIQCLRSFKGALRRPSSVLPPSPKGLPPSPRLWRTRWRAGRRLFFVFSGLASVVRRLVSVFRLLRTGVRRLSSGVCLQSAFTLIEVLVAMTVLSIMVLMVANIFQSSSEAWNIGTQKADMNTAARAALDYMARELQSAVAGPIEAVNPPASPISFEVIGGNDLLFRSLVGDVNNGRALRNGAFYHAASDNELMYAHQLANPYDPFTPPSHSGAGMLITNVLSLQFYVYTNESALASGNYVVNTICDQLPICMDIALEMLSDDDMRRYNQLSGADQTAFRDRNAKVYSTRVYFPNRKGYSAR